jgi:hypothetical protein
MPIEKQQFRNNTGGWIGAVQIGVKGDEQGVAVEPGGTVWLSEAEQILTANAPRRPEDNPFVAQEHVVTDQTTGARDTITVVPLEPINEGRYVPANERYVPADAGFGATQAAATGDEPVVLLSDAPTATSREAEVLAQGDDARPNVPPPPTTRAQAAAEAAAAAQEAASAPATPEASPTTPEAPTSPQEGSGAPEAAGEPTPTEEPSVTPETPATPPRASTRRRRRSARPTLPRQGRRCRPPPGRPAARSNPWPPRTSRS